MKDKQNVSEPQVVQTSGICTKILQLKGEVGTDLEKQVPSNSSCQPLGSRMSVSYLGLGTQMHHP